MPLKSNLVHSSFAELSVYCFVAVFGFFQPMVTQLLFLVGLVLIDFVCAVLSLSKRKEQFHVKKALFTIKKISYYTLLCAAGYIFDEIFVKEAIGINLFFSFLMLGISFNEFRSIVKHLSILLKIDIWAKFIKKSLKKSNIDL